MPPSNRPQTLKQAKKAYRKSGATVRLSESELAIIERRGVLQERADRIKEREARRKANIKRREERNQRERETRVRMGMQEPVKEGITHIGPSQMSLGGFLGGQGKRKREMEEEKENNGAISKTETTKAVDDFWRDQEERGCPAPSIQRIPWRNPLKIISANSTPRGVHAMVPFADESLNSKLRDSGTMAPPPSSSRNCLQSTSSSCAAQRIPPAPAAVQSTGLNCSKTKFEQHNERQRILMAPPRLPTDLQVIPPEPVTKSRPLHQCKGANAPIHENQYNRNTQSASRFLPPQRAASQCRPKDKSIQTKPLAPTPVDECWDDFFVSGTQIARELSPPLTRSIPKIPPLAPPSLQDSVPPPPKTKKTSHANNKTIPNISGPVRPPSPPKGERPINAQDNTKSLLDLLSTQDLDFSEILTQIGAHIVPDHHDADDLLAKISTQDLDFSGELTQIAPQAPSTVSSDFDEDLTEEDLEDAALEFERESTMAKSRTTTPNVQRTMPEARYERGHGELEKDTYKDAKPDFVAMVNEDSPEGENENDPYGFDVLESFLSRDVDMDDDPIDCRPDSQHQHAQKSSDDEWGNLDDLSDEDIKPDKELIADIKIKAEQETKTKGDMDPDVLKSCSQELQLAAQYDAFDLSTQDLRELES